MKPGDRVLVPGTLQMDGLGIEDEHSLVEVEDCPHSYVMVRTSLLLPADDHASWQVAPGAVVVSRDDLRDVLKQMGTIPPDGHHDHVFAAADRLRAAARPPALVCPGDVWAEKDGTRWFARTGVDGELYLVSEITSRTPVKPSDVFLRDMVLEWRRGGG